MIKIIALILCLTHSLALLAQDEPLRQRHPFLLVTHEEIEKVRAQIALGSWKYNSWEILRSEADKLMAESVELPPRGGNWEQYYLDASSEQELVRGTQIGDWKWEHIDRRTGKKYYGDTSSLQKDLDGVIISLIHDTWASAAIRLGLAYQISRDKRYAAKAREILLAYAELYPRLPVRKRNSDSTVTLNGKGKIHVQNLNESIWLIHMVQGADLVWEVLKPDERRKIASQVFIPAVNLIRDAPVAVFNIQCWKNTAIGLTGFLLNDKALIQAAITDTSSGFYTQVEKGVTREGIWLERSSSYHFYTLYSLVQLAQAANNYGYPIDLQLLRKMFTGPLLLASPTFQLPAFNDAKPIQLQMEDYLYEWAYTQFKDPRYIPVINTPARGKYKKLGPLFTGWGLLYGTDSVPQPPPPMAVASKNFSETGIAMLSQGTGKNALTLYLKYDPFAGAHTHYDELNFALFKGHESVSIAAGVKNYASRLGWNWYKTSISHNTFLLNEVMQEKSSGACIAFGKKNRVDYVITETRNAYDSVRFIRTACLISNNLALIVDQFQTEKAPQLLDIMYHQAGVWKRAPHSLPWKAPRIKGYKEITNAFIAPGLKSTHFSTLMPSGREVMVTMASRKPLDLIRGMGREFQGAEVPVAMFRTKTDRTVVAYCIATNGQNVDLQLRHFLDQNNSLIDPSIAVGIALTVPGLRLYIDINPDKLAVAGNEAVSENYISVRAERTGLARP